MKVLHVATDEGIPTATNPKRLTATANRPILAPKSDLCKLIWCTLIGLFRSRAALEAGALSLRNRRRHRGAPAPAGCGAVGRCRNCGVWRSRGSRASRAARSASVRTPAQGCPKRPRRPGSMPSRGFFAELTLRRLKRGVFRSVDDLKATINRLTPIQSPWSGPPPSSPLSNAGNKR